MSSFTEKLARKAAEVVHARRKDTADVIEEVRTGLAKLWEHQEPHAWTEATKLLKPIFEMTYECQYTYVTPDQMLELLPAALAEDVKNRQITCRQNMCNAALYHFEFFYGHKRDRMLAELEKDDPPSLKKARVADEEKKDEVKKDEPQGDAALEVKDEDVAAIKASVGVRVARVAAMTRDDHKAIMTQAVEALGFTVDAEAKCTLDVAWQRALLSEKCRETALAYERAIIEVEASV